MKRITKIRSVLFCICIILFHFAFFSKILAFNQFAGEKMIIVHREHNGKRITAQIGDLIQIELAELGSAGYSWFINHLDSQSLELVSEETRKLSEESRIGAPVIRVWRFKGKKEGQTEIKMDYYRKWEGIEKSADHFSINIQIIKNGGK